MIGKILALLSLCGMGWLPIFVSSAIVVASASALSTVSVFLNYRGVTTTHLVASLLLGIRCRRATLVNLNIFRYRTEANGTETALITLRKRNARFKLRVRIPEMDELTLEKVSGMKDEREQFPIIFFGRLCLTKDGIVLTVDKILFLEMKNIKKMQQPS
jgi:hypothetical protein